MRLEPDVIAPDVATLRARQLLRRWCCWTIAAIIVSLVVVLGVPLTTIPLDHIGPSWLLFWLQDVDVVPILLVVLLAVGIVPDRRACPALPSIVSGPAVPWLLAIVLALLCWAGHWLVFDGYDLTRDEQMATFDATIFSHGRLTWPIAPEWRPFAAALNQRFILPIGDHEAWVSGYLPVNAAFRALLGILADASLTGPLLVAVGALCLWRIGLRLWPDSPWSRLVALVLYAGSSQIVVTGMTAYAMSAHLGLDLVWLALFLRGGRVSHAGTVAIGFLATGLHQPLFHPLFALPFLDLLRRQKRWRLLVYYVLAYGLIGLFWLAWPIWISAHHVAAAPTTESVGFLQRLQEAIRPPDVRAAWLMLLNLLRFVTWQHVLLLPLLGPGLLAGRDDPIARALALGVGLTIVAVAIILPLQGNGWGYRYLHGVLGNVCLLGAYGWRWLETRGITLRRPLAWTSAVTFLVIMPAQAVLAHRWVAPFATLSREVGASGATFVIVEDRSILVGQDLVFNAPDLSNRPIRLLAGALRPEDMRELCRRGSVAFFDRAHLGPLDAVFGSRGVPAPTNLPALVAAAGAAGCLVVPP